MEVLASSDVPSVSVRSSVSKIEIACHYSNLKHNNFFVFVFISHVMYETYQPDTSNISLISSIFFFIASSSRGSPFSKS